VVVPVHNRAAIVGPCLDSVLHQTFADWECVVVDDGSEDGVDLEAVVAAFEDRRFRYLWRPNGGGGAARNTGIDAARGIFVAFLDSDDAFLPEKLAAFLRHARPDDRGARGTPRPWPGSRPRAIACRAGRGGQDARTQDPIGLSGADRSYAPTPPGRVGRVHPTPRRAPSWPPERHRAIGPPSEGDNPIMNVTIIGTGYVGLTTGTALSYVGHDVTCVDIDERVVAKLRAGTPTIFETGLAELLADVQDRMRVQTTIPALAGRGVVLIAVGTPTRADGDADLKFVDQAAKDVAAAIQPGAELVVVNKSTVPIGSANHVRGIIDRALAQRGVEATVHVASNPEFLAEGRAVHDSFYPDRIVIGADHPDAIAMLRELYAPILEQTFDPPAATPRPERYPLPSLITTSTTSAELTKYAANSFLATKISFINEFAGLAERVGADITQVARAIGLDDRIGPRFLHAGIGWGGSCFAKDTRAIVATAERYGHPMQIVQSAIDVNRRQRQRVVEKLQDHLKVLRGMTIGLLGLSFKGGTDDLRDAPALTLIELLDARGAVVRAHDPIAIPRTRAQHPDLPATLHDTAAELAQGCDALVVVTDWNEYRHLDWSALAGAMRGTLVLDARNLLGPQALAGTGLQYVGIGR